MLLEGVLTSTVDWGYVAFWIGFAVVVALLLLAAYLLFRRPWSKHPED
jgi:hypothetical protein